MKTAKEIYREFVSPLGNFEGGKLKDAILQAMEEYANLKAREAAERAFKDGFQDSSELDQPPSDEIVIDYLNTHHPIK